VRDLLGVGDCVLVTDEHRQDRSVRKGRNGLFWAVCVCHYMTPPVAQHHDARYLMQQHIALEARRAERPQGK
jgi:hypothetical protein